jgi:DNA-binding response OmpR family regulator
MRILFVDDEPSIREVFQISLGTEYPLTIAEDGVKALDVARRQDFDLIITDISLPGMSGIDFIKTLRREGNFTPFIIITGDSNIELAIDTFRMGAIDFFLKPFRVGTIKSVVEKFQSMHINKDELIHSQDLTILENKNLFILMPKITRINYYVNLLILNLQNLPNFREEDQLAMKVTLYELISNAIEHGTAGLNYNDKKKYLESSSSDYFNYIDERCKGTDKRVRVYTSYTPTELEVTIEDDGDGFDPSKIPNPITGSSVNLYSGRGIFLTKLNIDEIHFNEKGNSVRVIRKLSKSSKD